MKRRSILGEAILLTLFGLALLVFAYREEAWPMTLRLILAGAGVVFLALAIYAAYIWIAVNMAELDLARNKAAAWTEAVQLANIVSRWSPEVAAQFLQFRVPVETLIAGETGPLRLLRCADEDVPLSFLEDWLPKGQGDYLPAVRDLTSEREREWAGAFISFGYQRGWLALPAGNQCAKWTNYQAFTDAVYGKEGQNER